MHEPGDVRQFRPECRLLADSAHLTVVLILDRDAQPAQQLTPLAIHLVVAQVAELARSVDLGSNAGCWHRRRRLA